MRIRLPLFTRLGMLISALLLSPHRASAVDEKLLSNLKTFVAKESPKLGSGLSVSFLVVALDSDEVLFSENEEEALIPASVQKLLLTLTALRTLGGQYRFPTEVFLDHLPREVDVEGKPRVDFQPPVTSVGNLYLRGYGDPSMDSLRMLDLAQAVRQYGVEKVEDVILDDSLIIGAPQAVGPRPSEAGSSGLTINQNAFAVYVAPNRAAASAFLSLTPGLSYQILNQVLTIRGREQSIAIDTQVKKIPLSVEGTPSDIVTGKVQVRGTIGQDLGGLVLWQSLPDIPQAFGEILVYSLKKAGIEVKGKVRFREVPQNANLLETFQSKSLSEILRDMNQQSSNVMASQILFALGQDEKGYFRSELGLRRLNSQLTQLSSAKDRSTQLVDASGFDRRNRLSAKHIVAVLKDAARDFSLAPDFMASLGKFGEVGTLKPRVLMTDEVTKGLRGEELRKAKLRARSVWAKTGTLEGVSSLAGYAVTKTDERVVFALIENNAKDKSTASDFEDGFVRTLLGLIGETSEVDLPVVPKEDLLRPATQ